MPPQYPESPLNKLADSLPGFILEMQEMKIRQDAYEALNSYRQGLLAETIKRNRLEVETRAAIEIERERRGLNDPPEVKALRDEILYSRRVLSDPNAVLMLGDDQIIKRWKHLTNLEADLFGRTRRVGLGSMPVSVEEALAREQRPKKPQIQAAPPKEKTFPSARLGETEAGYRRRIEEPVITPPFTEGGEPRAISENSGIPEGAYSVNTNEGGVIYTLDDGKTWISAETGKPIQ